VNIASSFEVMLIFAPLSSAILRIVRPPRPKERKRGRGSLDRSQEGEEERRCKSRGRRGEKMKGVERKKRRR
jgi:hypothetical protein